MNKYSLPIELIQLPELEKCSKTKTLDGSEADFENPSEWAYRYAVETMGDEEISDEDFVESVFNAQVTSTVSELLEDGCLEMSWGENGDTYKLTQKGRDRIKDL